jgi:Uma2 family endonuclease
MTVQVPVTLLTPEEYLALERASELKHEYRNGEMIAMTGASRRHNLIVANILALLHHQLRKRPCEVYPSNMRVKIEQTGRYTYPDIIVVCDRPRLEDAVKDTLLNPTVIVEVLSKSTSGYDRGEKFEHYRTIDSLTNYLLVAQDKVHVEHYARQANGSWLFSEFKTNTQTITIDTIGCTLLIEDIYEKVDLQSDSGMAINGAGEEE